MRSRRCIPRTIFLNSPAVSVRLPANVACVLGINEDPVSIRVLEWNIIDRGFNEGYVEPVLPVVKTGKTVSATVIRACRLDVIGSLNRTSTLRSRPR